MIKGSLFYAIGFVLFLAETKLAKRYSPVEVLDAVIRGKDRSYNIKLIKPLLYLMLITATVCWGYGVYLLFRTHWWEPLVAFVLTGIITGMLRIKLD